MIYTKKLLSADHYADAFGEVMHYARARVGTRQLKNKEDLRNYIIESDLRRVGKGGNSRISKDFLDRVTSDEVLRRVQEKRKYLDLHSIAKTVLSGREDKPVLVEGERKNISRTPNMEEKVVFYRAKRREIYNHPEGKAIKVGVRRKGVVTHYQFKDITTGKWIKTKLISEE